jgi:predicted DNA-binding transcriptional regulator AlpA
MTKLLREPAPAPPPLAPLLVGADGFGRLVDLSSRTVRRLNSMGAIPKPLRVSGSLRWRVAEIEAWVEAGCPDRDTWEHLKQ